MSNQAVRNNQGQAGAYFALADIAARVDTLDLTVAYSSLTAPAPNTLALWADQGAGVYPLTADRGATQSCAIAVTPTTGNMSNVSRIQFAANAINTGLHEDQATGHLFYNAVDLEDTGTGDVTGPASSVDGTVVAFDGITGKLIKQSPATTRVWADPSLGNVSQLAIDTTAGATIPVIKEISNGSAVHLLQSDIGGVGSIPSRLVMNGTLLHALALSASDTAISITSAHDNTVPGSGLDINIYTNSQYPPIAAGETPAISGGDLTVQISNLLTRFHGGPAIDSDGFAPPNVMAPSPATTVFRYYEYGFATLTTTGPWAVPPNLLVHMERIGNMVHIQFGSALLSLADGAAPAVITTSAIPARWRTTVSNRNGLIAVVNNGIAGASGTWRMETTGVITITNGVGTGFSGTFSAPVAGQGGVLGQPCLTYSIQ